MTYALLVYDVPRSWHKASPEQNHALHTQFRHAAASPGVTSHFRFQAPRKTTTIRVVDGQIQKRDGPLGETTETLRALYLIDSDDHESVIELAAQIPTARTGGAIEVWQVTDLEPEHYGVRP